MASYFGDSNVRVNCIALGGVYDNQDKSFVDRYVSKVPIGRMASPEDVKGLVVFLASAASSYITGAVIPVDGGLTIT